MSTKQVKGAIMNSKNLNGTGISTINYSGRPGAKPKRRTLYVFILVDNSYSMAGAKMQVSNVTLQCESEVWVDVAKDNGCDIKVQIIRFGEGAEAMFEEPVNVEDLELQDLVADGCSTDNGMAFKVLGGQLNNVISHRMLPPLIVELSDGQPTDEYKGALANLQENPLFQKSVKLAVAIGPQAHKSKCLLEFVGGNPELVWKADDKNPGDISKAIKWATTSSIVRQSQGPSDNDIHTGDLNKVVTPDSQVTW